MPFESVDATVTRPSGAMRYGVVFCRSDDWYARSSLMKPCTCDVSVAIAPPPIVRSSPPVLGTLNGEIRVPSCREPRQSPRSVSVCSSASDQSKRTMADPWSARRSAGMPGSVGATPIVPSRVRNRLTESWLAPRRDSVCAFATRSEESGLVRRETEPAPKTNISSSRSGPPTPKLSEFCRYFCPNVADDSSTNSSSGSRSA